MTEVGNIILKLSELILMIVTVSLIIKEEHTLTENFLSHII